MNDFRQKVAEKRKKNIAFRLGNQYLKEKTATIHSQVYDGDGLTKSQRQQVKEIRRRLYFYAALIGAVAVLVVVLPFHLFPSVFGAQHLKIFGYQFDFELYYSIYALVLLFPEIWLLNVVNLRAVRALCTVFRYPTVNHNDYEEQVALLTEAGLEMPSEHMKMLEVNPYIGLSKFSYYALFLLNKAKAMLSNVVMKLVVKRFLGRYALRIVTDLAGVPIYAFWDAWASHLVLKEAEMRIVSSGATANFLGQFSVKELKTVETQLPFLINFIAQQKRQYNFALYRYMKGFVQRIPELNLRIDRKIHISDVLTDDLEKNKLLGRLLVFGFIVDGTLSVTERLLLFQHKEEAWFPMSIDELEEILGIYLKTGEMKMF